MIQFKMTSAVPKVIKANNAITSQSRREKSIHRRPQMSVVLFVGLLSQMVQETRPADYAAGSSMLATASPHSARDDCACHTAAKEANRQWLV